MKKLRPASATGNLAKQPRGGKLRQRDHQRRRAWVAANPTHTKHDLRTPLALRNATLPSHTQAPAHRRDPPVHIVLAPARLSVASARATQIPFDTVRARTHDQTLEEPDRDSIILPHASAPAPSTASAPSAFSKHDSVAKLPTETRAARDRRIATRHSRIAAIWLVMVGLGAAVGQASWHPADRLPEPQLTIVASLHKAPIKAPARPAIEIAEPLVPPLLPHPPPAVAGPMLSPSPRPAPAEAVTAPSNPPAAPRQTETADLPGFGVRLATAALEQTRQPVSYDPRYFKIGYPMGDVPAELGVCTDVIVRAYRTFGIDLQELVHLTKVGPGDTNIDHRRVEVLRKFFARFGETLVPTEYAEDYLPGDIVIYSRPGRPHKTSTTHVAMVTGVLAPSGRPMLVHNRGYGPMLEDALFADPITGHYRFRTTDAQQVAALAGRPRPAPVLAKARRLATTSKSSVSAR